ncbi:hypothetical protein BJX65DRAFT_308999 [Aspergillus insuetus]
MDLFLYNPTYHLWICTAPRCQYAVTPSTLLTHLRTCHGSHPTMATLPLREAALAAMLQRPWADPAREPGRQPPAGDPPVPGLPVYQGYGCLHCAYIARALDSTKKHRRVEHQEQDGTWGSCTAAAPAAALLGCPPDEAMEPLLVQFGASVQRLVGQAYHAIQSGQINEFDQIQINTFHRESRVWNRPILSAGAPGSGACASIPLLIPLNIPLKTHEIQRLEQ